MTAVATPRDLKWVWVAAEVLLAATSVTTVLLLGRIFSGTEFVAPLVFSVLVAHAALIAARWAGFGVSVGALASLVGVIVAVVASHYASSAIAAIIPTSETLDLVQLDLDAAGQVFRSQRAPVPAVTGFLIMGSFAFWALTLIADWAAFRLLSPGQALIPPITVLVFVSLLGTDTDRVSTTALVVITAILFVLAHRAASRAVDGIWLDRGPGRGYTSLMAAGAVVAAAAAAAGIAGGPAVPGADEAPLIELGDEGRRETKPIEVISPLVQIQPRLVDQSDQILFFVETNERAYWRIAALDMFDGQLWRSQGQYRSTGDDLEVSYPAGAPSDRVVSTFDLRDLGVVWAPAAYIPVRLENFSNVDLNYEAETATFIVDTDDRRVSDGLVYRITSSVPDFTPELLRRLPQASTAVVDPRYLSLPADYSPLARSVAERLTNGLTHDYDKALALQTYFRENFTYDIDVAKGHDIRRIEDFLSVQRGYCEQFAGTFASMARSIGLPARVATGFTPGDPDPTNPSRYVVRGRHAHAWPEVWIAGAGWVSFEPTPGRGAPNATEYTGVPETQEAAPSESFDQPPDESELLTQPVAPTPTPSLPEPFTPDSELALPEFEQTVGADNRSLPIGALLVIIALVALLLVALGVPALKRWQAARQRSRAGSDRRRLIALAWSQVVDRFDADGHEPNPSETLTEYAERLRFEVPASYPSFDELTALTVDAAYAPNEPDTDSVDRAFVLASRINRALDDELPPVVRTAHGLDPRPLLRLGDPVGTRAERLAAGATTATESPAAVTIDGPGDPLLEPTTPDAGR